MDDGEGPPGEIFGSSLAYAETNVLARLPFRGRWDLVLITTLQPCLQCAGAILRRLRLDREPDAVRQVGGLYLDLAGQAARIGGRAIELTPSEFRVLAMLAAEPGRVFTRREIARRLGRGAAAADERVCAVHVKNLRRKIEDDPARPRRVVTVRGVGYLLRSV